MQKFMQTDHVEHVPSRRYHARPEGVVVANYFHLLLGRHLALHAMGENQNRDLQSQHFANGMHMEQSASVVYRGNAHLYN
jgi:hypothetical protein